MTAVFEAETGDDGLTEEEEVLLNGTANFKVVFQYDRLFLYLIYNVQQSQKNANCWRSG